MKKKELIVKGIAFAMTMAMLAGCANTTAPESSSGEAETMATQEEESKVIEKEKSDQERADEVAALIDAIYVQQRTEQTDEQCTAAKAAWDALTDAQKALVEGENADPDYFGRDTGDASKDDPLNQDNIGEKELLVVSFGTSFNNSRVEDIHGVETALQAANPDWSVRRAFTAQIIINHVQARDGEKIDNMEQALERAVANGVKSLVVQPTHLMHGAEYDELVEELDKYRDRIENIQVAEPLLGPVGKDATVINSDKQETAKAVVAAGMKAAGYNTPAEGAADGAALVLMGHGTAHNAKITYSQMQTQMNNLGYENVFVGTVEGEPEDTACEAVIEKVAAAGYKKVILRPLMVVAGDHAHNDMAGDEEDSWKSMFTASGKFDSVDTQVSGMGSIPEIQEIYKQHTAEAIQNIGKESSGNANGQFLDATALKEGVEYEAKFSTDSGMFHVSEACEGKGVLTVKDGKLTIHVSLSGKSVLNLYPGLAEDAQKDGAVLLQPTTDTVTFADGTTEEVYGYDVPVPYLNDEFDLALVGTKGKWYDHKVSVSEVTEKNSAGNAAADDKKEKAKLAEGEYETAVTLTGGSGKATVESPAKIKVIDGQVYVVLVWNSKNYDYMLVDGEKYLNEAAEGENSMFTVPVKAFDQELTVIGDTIAMSKPHEVEYTLVVESVQ